jgi:hypothetical protein
MISNLNTKQTEHAREVRLRRKVRRDPDLRRLQADKLTLEVEVLDLRRQLADAVSEIARLQSGAAPAGNADDAAEAADMFGAEQAVPSKRKPRT